MEYDSKNYGKFIVLEGLKYKPRQRYKIQFVETGTITIARRFAIVEGAVKDIYKKNILGVACIGNANTDNIKLYRCWRNMLDRVYNTSRHNYINYENVSICERWHCYEYFADDVPHLEGFNQTLLNEGMIQLDKDLATENAKVYSPETCGWLTPEENNKLRDTSTYRRHLNIYRDDVLIAEDVSIVKAMEIVGSTAEYIQLFIDGIKTKKGYKIIDLAARKSVETIP